MPVPGTSTVTARPDLAATIQQYPIALGMRGAIGHLLFPIIEVDYQSGNYGLIPPKEILTPRTAKRASDGSYQRSTFKFQDKQWATQEYGAEQVVDERRANRYADYFDAEQIAAQLAQFEAIQAAEIRCADLATDVSAFSGQTTAAGTDWTDWSGSDPIDNMESAATAVYDRTGLWPKIGYCSKKTFRNLRNNDKVIERIEATGAGQPAKSSDISADLLAKVFDLEKILVGEMSVNDANPGQDESISGVWSDSIFGLAVVDEGGNMEMPTAFRSFHWAKDGSSAGVAIEHYDSDANRSRIIRARQDIQEKVEISEMVQLITGVA
jgi:hypothetical protein